MTRNYFAATCAAIGLSSLLLGTAQAQQIFSGSGANTTIAFDDFRNAIGGGRRIAWDGVRLDGTDANPNTVVIDSGHTVAIPVDRFQNVGVLFDQPIVTDVTLTVGTHALFSFDGTTLSSFGPQNLANGIDLAITEDFVFAEPTQFTAVPEPSTAALFASGMALLVAQRLRRLRRK